MSRHTLEDAKESWAEGYAGLTAEDVDLRVRGLAVLIRGIARAGFVKPDEFAQQVGVDSERAKEIFSALATFGLELDDAGNIVGAALTSRKTPHVVRLRNRDLYAWCSLDTLFIPGLLGEAAVVESTCPVTGEAIRLEVSADGVRSYSPEEAVLSVILPGASPAQTGPASPT